MRSRYFGLLYSLVPLVSVVLGLVVGELLSKEGTLRRFGDRLEKQVSQGRARSTGRSSRRACSSLSGQSTLTLGAAPLGVVVPVPMIFATTAIGGILALGLGLVLLDLQEIWVATMLPAPAFAPLLATAAPPVAILGCW